MRGVRSLSGQAYSFFGWTSGGTWCWLNGFALWHLAGSSSRPELDAVDAACLLVTVLGFVIEMVADVQK